MKTLSYHGTLDETHLKRLNVTLHGIAQNEWNIVKNYSRQYNLAWNSYIKGAEAYLADATEANSNYQSKTSELTKLVTTMMQTDSSTISAVQEAQQSGNEAQQEAKQEMQEQQENTGISESAVNEAIQAEQEARDEFDKASEKSAEAMQAANDAYENLEDHANAQSLANYGTEGTASYYNPETGQQETYTKNADGSSSISGVTASDGTVGTVTKGSDGTLTFTTEDGRTMPWTGDTPESIVSNAGKAVNDDAQQKLQENEKAMEELQKAQEDLNKASEEASSKELDLEEQNRENAQKDDPDTTNGNDDWGEWGDFVNGD